MIKKNLLLVTVASLVGAASASLLTGCVHPKEDKSNPCDSLKNCLTYMSEEKTFSLSLQSGSSAPIHDIVYSENCMGVESVDALEMTKIFYSDKKGTYEINYNGEDYVGSEYRSEKNVWETNLYPTFMGVGEKTINKLTSEDKTCSLMEKDYKLLFARLITGDSSNMLDINAISASYSNLGVMIDISYKTYSFKYLAHEFKTAYSGTAKDYTGQGNGALDPDYELDASREGILTNNFKQDVYNYGETPETTGYAYEYGYNEHYFTQKSKAASLVSGYISLNCGAVTDGENPHPALKGIYLFQEVAKNQFSINSQAYNLSPNLVEVMNYPSLLMLWDNLHLVKEGKGKGPMGDFSIAGKAYYVDDPTLLADASNNLMSSSSFEGQQPIGLVLDVEKNNSGITRFTIYYQFKIGNSKYVYPFPFYDFGKANNKTLDAIWAEYNDIAE